MHWKTDRNHWRWWLTRGFIALKRSLRKAGILRGCRLWRTEELWVLSTCPWEQRKRDEARRAFSDKYEMIDL